MPLHTAAPPPSSSRLSHIPSAQPLLLRMASGKTRAALLPIDLSAGSSAQRRAAPEGPVVSLGKLGTFRSRAIEGLPFGHSYELVGGEVPNSEDRWRKRGAGASDSDDSEEEAKPRKGGKMRKPAEVRILVQGPEEEIAEENDASNEHFGGEYVPALTALEVDALRAAGVDGRLIVQAASEKNATFQQKTAYAQDKYRKKKEMKHMRIFTPLAPTTYNVAAFHFERSPEKLLHLRADALSQMLSFGNVGAGGRYIVVDGVGGLLAGAVLERLGGEGRVFIINEHDSAPTLELFMNMNLPPEYIEPVLRSVNWAVTERRWRSLDEPVAVDEAKTTPAGKPIGERDRQRMRKRRALFEEHERTRQELFDGEFDGLLVASQFEPVSVIERLLPFVAGSGSIAVHSPYLQPLVEAHARLRLTPHLINFAITEPWLRKYQVLPGRTHPEMTTSSSAGYVLSATRVLTDAESEALEAAHAQEMEARRAAEHAATAQPGSADATTGAAEVAAEPVAESAEAQPTQGLAPEPGIEADAAAEPPAKRPRVEE